MSRALCVGRHRYLSEHVGSFFRAYGLETECVVGLEQARLAAMERMPDLVLCDYDLLATASLTGFEQDEQLSRVPVIAVSLTRRPTEVHLLDVNGIAGFLYLPTLDRETARRALGLSTHAVPSLPLAREWSRSSVRS